MANDWNFSGLPFAPIVRKGRLIPKRVVVETVFGCNAKCPMCLIDHPTERAKGVMDMAAFESLVESLVPYKDHIDMFDLFGLGEPLIDAHLAERVRLLKDQGIRGTAVSTNGHLLNAKWQGKLLGAGLDTLLVSIDGAIKETHEAIRQRTNFERCVNNVVEMIRQRDAGDYTTRFIVRFICQPLNAPEWDAFRDFWSGHLDRDKGDGVFRYDMHDWSGQIESETAQVQAAKGAEPCHHLFEKLVILADGSVALCFEDILDGHYGYGNVFETDPIEVFNSKPLNKLRRLHLAGKRKGHNLCGPCSVLDTEAGRVEG